MTEMSDLTVERLDQYERAIESARKRGQKKRMIHLETWSALIAMARDKKAAEDGYELWHAESEMWKRKADGLVRELADAVTAARGSAQIAKAAERERDVLRALVMRFVALVQADDEEGYSCSDCSHRGYVPHDPHCICVEAAAVLAQPTDAGEKA